VFLAEQGKIRYSEPQESKIDQNPFKEPRYCNGRKDNTEKRRE
jgi:hypothetical protein